MGNLVEEVNMPVMWRDGLFMEQCTAFTGAALPVPQQAGRASPDYLHVTLCCRLAVGGGYNRLQFFTKLVATSPS